MQSIRRGAGGAPSPQQQVSKSEMRGGFARSRELGLVFCADTVQRGVMFVCQCCGCCCNALLAISRFGCANFVTTSSFVADSDPTACEGCGGRACPIHAIEMVADSGLGKRAKKPRIDLDLCPGCGVCALKCKSGAIKLHKRPQRVLHPDTMFERTILQCLERGTLQNQLFDDPGSKTQAFLRGFAGAFLQLPPVKRALMSNVLRSRFLHTLKLGARAGGKQW